MLSAATITGADGISFFSYHAHVYQTGKTEKQVERSRTAVVDGLKVFDLITSKISRERNALAVYFPYSDWIIERWANYFMPALDAFRVLGVPVDVVPYAPPLEESVYPYYPFHMNRDVLARLVKERTVLILPNVSGFQQTDSDLIKAFVEQGGVIVAFGPQIPMGRSYEREDLFGIDEVDKKSTHSELIVRERIGKRAAAGSRFPLKGKQLPSWTASTARTIASFEDGSPAIAAKKYGQGTIITVLLDAWTAAREIPELARDVLNYAVALRGGAILVDVVGANENSDVATTKTSTGFRVAMVNYESVDMDVILRPTESPTKGDFTWIDLFTNKKVATDQLLRTRIPANGFRVFEAQLSPGAQTQDQ